MWAGKHIIPLLIVHGAAVVTAQLSTEIAEKLQELAFEPLVTHPKRESLIQPSSESPFSVDQGL